MNSQLSYDELKSFIRRRKKIGLVTFSMVFTAAIILAVGLPPLYQSQATISIAEQQISEDYIKSVMSNSPEERMQRLTNTIMTYSQLEKVIEKHNLYPELQKKGEMNEAVQRIKKNITLEPVITEVFNPKNGRSIPVASVLILAFQGENPEQVKEVTQALANLYVEEDVKKREKIAVATTGFLEDELERLKTTIREQEANISEFKREHLGELPENSLANSQIIARLESELSQTESRIRYLEERKIYLNGQLASIPPIAPVSTSEGIIIRNPHDRLKAARMELLKLQTYLSEKHPDVTRTKREIAELEKQLGKKAGSVDQGMILSRKKAELAQLEEKFGPKYPDVIRLKKEINSLSSKATDNNSRTQSYDYEKPDNPAYINISTQIAATDAEMKSQMENKEQILIELEKYRSQIKNAPIVESQLNEMMRNYENTRKNYNELMDKLMNARISQAIEQKDRGTKFKIADPAYLPDSPSKPNRLAIVLLGFILAFGSGFGMAAIKEATDRSIKSEEELTGITDVPILTTITLVGKK